jgi:hypothetical protein
MQKKILLTTIHPAPYIDIWIKALEKEFYVGVFYCQKKDKDKQWKQYEKYGCVNSYFYSDYSFYEKIKIFKRYDFVLLGGWGIIENIFLCLVLIPFKTKIAFFCDHPVVGTSKTNLLAKEIKKIIIKSADYLFPASESCKDYFHNVYHIDKRKMKVFPYAHSLSISDIHSINKQREMQLKAGDRINLFIANNFIERKGYAVIAKAFEQLRNLNLLNKMHIRIAGNGENFSYYKQIFNNISNDIVFLSWIENEQYEEEMNNCDIFLHASIFEPFGIPPLDALQRGKYTIVSDGVKSLNHCIDSAKQRLYRYPANEYIALADILKRAIENRIHLYDNYNDTIAFIEKEYSIKKNI